MNYTTVDRIFSKFTRELKGTDFNESDVIEMIGEALEFLKVEQVQEQAVAFIEVKNHEASMPDGFQMVLQVARNNYWEKEKDDCTPCKTLKKIQDEPEQEVSEDDCDFCKTTVLMTDCNGFIINSGDIVDYRPQFDMKLYYDYWTHSNYYKRNFSPVRLANNTFYNTIVCKQRVDDGCRDCTDEYTIVGTVDKKLRFSFKDGQIALSYLKNAIDENTGYPLVPDQISYITAITYYIKWKLAEWYVWNGRAGYANIAEKSQERWEHYVKQAKNFAKIPKSIDDYQDLLEQSFYLIPNHKKYYGYFGSIGRSQRLGFNDHNINDRTWM